MIVIVVILVITIITCATCTAGAAAWGGMLLGSVATTAVTNAVRAWAVSFIGGAFLGGIAGGLNAALTGGNFGDVLRGATIGGVQGGITAGLLHGLEPAAGSGGFNVQTAIHVAGHGIVGGAANAAMGGKFQDGFISGAVSAAASDLGAFDCIQGKDFLAVAGRTAMAGIVGGTASALGGGKFANGAFTAAFQHLLNHENGMSKTDQDAADYEASTGEKVSWLTKLFMNHETIAAVSENSTQAVMGFADGATGGLDAAARAAIYGDSYSDTGSWYYRGGYVGGVAANTIVTNGAVNSVKASFTAEKALFWGGIGKNGAATAQAEAIRIGATTLGMTKGGMFLAKTERILQFAGFSESFTTKLLWKPGSWMFAKNAQSYAGLVGKGGEIWRKIEMPILQSRGLIP